LRIARGHAAEEDAGRHDVGVENRFHSRLLGSDFSERAFDIFGSDPGVSSGFLDFIEKLLELLWTRGFERFEDDYVALADNNEADPGLKAEPIADLFWDDNLPPRGELRSSGTDHGRLLGASSY